LPYSAEISRANPTAFVFVVDQSASMADLFGGGEESKTKARGVADAMNRILQELAIKCAKEEGVRDYFDIAVIGYGAQVGPAFSGALAGRDFVPISDVANNPARIEERARKEDDGAGGLIERSIKFPIWFDAKSEGGTPMTAAFTRVKSLLEDWIASHPGSHPPIVMHFTDGESTDGDPSSVADAIKLLVTADGASLLLNMHLSSSVEPSIRYPDSDGGLPNDYARMLFAMSSYLPRHVQQALSSDGQPASDGTKGFVYNAELTDVAQFLDIGTRTSDLR
jgi:hypothetical protein